MLLAKYRVDGIVGRGGMGLVMKAWHLGLNEEVAIKTLRTDVVIAQETITRFLREAQAAAKLKSEHIARITDVGMLEDGKPYLVMEYLEGQDLGQLLAERGQLQPSLAIELVLQACEALAEAHSLGIVHRDIKPTNLFLTSHPDGSLLLKVLDFGISKSPAKADLSLTQTWSLLGSPAYMSPEQMRSARDVDARTDVWSLGTVLYEALEGRLPFEAESFSELCVAVAVDTPTPTSATPPALAPIVARCLAKNPDDRYASVAELGRDLARLAREPDKARVLVDRMFRMLGRGVVRRTPPSGVAVTPVAMPAGTPQPWPPGGGVPHERPGARAAFHRPDSAGAGVVAHELAGASSSAMAFAPALPGTRDSGHEMAARESRTELPLAHRPASQVGLAPGWPLVAGPPAPRPATRGCAALTRTHVISRSRHNWLVTFIAAIIALAAAAAVAAATHADPAPRRSSAAAPAGDDGSAVVRMRPVDAAPAPAPAPAK